jgi:hypothetical protein
LKKGIHLGESLANLSESIAGAMAEQQRDEEDQGQEQEGQQGKPPMQVKEHEDDPDQKEDILEQVNQDSGKHLMNVLDIVGEPGHQPPDRVLIKKGYRKGLDMREKSHPKIMHRPLTRHFHQIDLIEIQAEVGDQDQHNEAGDAEDSCHILPSQGEQVLLGQIPHPIQ